MTIKKSRTVRTLLATLIASILLSGCRGGGTEPNGMRVMASFYPLYEIARQVGGERATVENLVPTGTESHEFEPTPKDTAALFNARMVVYNGAGFEPWLNRLLPELQKKGIVLVDASNGVDLLQMSDEEGPSRKVPDPHLWLDPVLMQKVVISVRDAYIEIDPDGRATYEANATAYNARLEALDRKYRQELQGYAGRTFVTSHAAFSYLAKRYNIKMVAIAGISPINEPSPQQLAEIVKLVRERGIRHIFFETLVSPLLAETIAREVGAETLMLNPLEGLTAEEIRSGKDYISVMEDNLANLKKALEVSR